MADNRLWWHDGTSLVEELTKAYVVGVPAGSQSTHILSRPETTLLLYRSYHHGYQLKVLEHS